MKRLFQKAATLLLSLALIASSSAAGTVFASESDGSVSDSASVVYDADQWDVFSDRTKEEIGQQYSLARYSGSSFDSASSASWYDRVPSLSSPYDPGQLTQDTHTMMTQLTNYFRWLVGADPLQRVSVHSDDLQAGALVRNWDFNHSVDDSNKPEDMPDALWQQGADANHNILARGYNPQGAINGWLNEGYNVSTETFDTIGHRQALLSSRCSGVQFGFAGSITIGLCTEYNNQTTQPFYAFPPPGYMPLEQISASRAAWSIELNSDIISNPSIGQVKVTVTNLNTGESYLCTRENGKLAGSSTIYFAQPPVESGSRYSEGDRFLVEVNGLEDVATGQEAVLRYTVEMFSVNQYTPSMVDEVTTLDGWSKIVLTQQRATTQNLQMLAALLPDQVQITTEAGGTAILPVSGEWVLDEENSRWVNRADPANLPEGYTDPDGLLNEISISYVIQSYTGSFSSTNYNPIQGSSGTFRLWRYQSGAQLATVYQVVADEQGGYTAIPRFDTQSEEFSVNDSGYYIFTVDSFELEDSGTYFGLYYYPSTSVFSESAYLAGSCTIQVSAPSLTSIALTGLPEKTTYLEGDELDLTGLEVTANYNNGTSVIVSDYALSGYDSTPGEKTVTVSYGGQTANFSVTVEPKTLTSIALTGLPEKTTYLEGEEFNPAGLKVTAYYNNGPSEVVTDYTLFGYDSTPGEKTVTVSYGSQTAVFTVTVTPKSFTSIAVTGYPNKTTYIEGQELDATGLAITAYYDNNTSELITGYTLSGYTSTPGTKTITVSYGGFTTSFTVTVEPKSLTSIAVARQPNQTVYQEGDAFDAAGLEVTAYYNNGTSQQIADYTLSGFDSSVLGEQTITVTYHGFTASFAVLVRSVAALPYDFNNDGVEDLLDVMWMAQQIVNSTNDFILDLNEDGKVDVLDVMTLAQILVG